MLGFKWARGWRRIIDHEHYRHGQGNPSEDNNRTHDHNRLIAQYGGEDKVIINATRVGSIHEGWHLTVWGNVRYKD